MEADNKGTNRVDLRDLKRVIDLIFDHAINDLKIQEVLIDSEADLYWEILAEQYDSKDKNPEVGIGRLSDDWEFLQAILKDRSNAVSLMLMHVSPLLRFIGKKIGQ